MEADILYDILSGKAQYVKPQAPPPVDVDKIFKLSSQYPLGSLIGMPKYPQQHPQTPRVNLLSPRGSSSSSSTQLDITISLDKSRSNLNSSLTDIPDEKTFQTVSFRHPSYDSGRYDQSFSVKSDASLLTLEDKVSRKETKRIEEKSEQNIIDPSIRRITPTSPQGPVVITTPATPAPTYQVYQRYPKQVQTTTFTSPIPITSPDIPPMTPLSPISATPIVSKERHSQLSPLFKKTPQKEGWLSTIMSPK